MCPGERETPRFLFQPPRPGKLRQQRAWGRAGNTPGAVPSPRRPSGHTFRTPSCRSSVGPGPRGLLTPGVPSPMSGKRQRHKVLSQPEREGVKHRVGAVTGPCCQDSLTGTSPWATALLPGCALPRGPGWVSQQSPHSSYCRCPEGHRRRAGGCPCMGPACTASRPHNPGARHLTRPSHTRELGT